MVPVHMNPQTNPGLASSAPLTMGLTPGEQASQVKGPIGPKGEQTVIPQAQYAQQNGLGGLVQGGAPGQSSPFANGGRLPPALLNRSNQQAGSAPPAPTGSIGAGSPGYAPASSAPPSAASVTPAAATAPAPGTPAFINHTDQRFPAPGAQPPTPQPQAASMQPGAAAAPPATVGIPAPSAPAPPQYGAPMVVGLGPGGGRFGRAVVSASQRP